MHCRLQFAGSDGCADLRDKRPALAAMRQQFSGLVDIAGGFELDDLDRNTRHRAQRLPRDLVRLGERHGALVPHRIPIFLAEGDYPTCLNIRARTSPPHSRGPRDLRQRLPPFR
jgi:hypothetical protein